MKSIKLFILFLAVGVCTLNAQLKTFPESGELDSLGKNLMKPLNDNFNLHQSAINSNTLSISELETMVDDSFAYYRIVTKSNKDSILLLRVDMSAIEDSLQALRALVNAIDTSGSGSGGEPPVINYPVTDFTITPATLTVNEGNSTPYFLGKFSATDPEDSTVVFAKRIGTGDANNILFSISNDSLFLTTTVNYDLGATRSLRAGASDGNSWVEKVFTLNVNDTILSIEPVQDTSWIHINFTKPGSTYSMTGLTNLDQDTLTVDNLENDQGYSTNLSIELSPNMLPNTSSIYADSNDSLFDASVYNSAWRGGTGEDSWMVISGLEPNQEYLIWMYSNSATGRIFDIDFNGESSLVGFNSSDNNYIIQDEFTADAQGRIRIDFTNVQTYLILNYIGIRGLSAFETTDVIQPPSELSAIISNDTTYLSWQDNSDIETKTYIFFKTEFLDLFSKIDSVGPGINSYEHIGVPSDTLLSYYVVARNDTLLSQASPVVHVERSTAPPGDITNFSATPYQTSISLSWNTTNANTIRVNYTTTVEGGLWSEKTFAGDITSGSITSLQANTPYYVRIRAENNFGISDWSDTLNVVTLSESQRYVIPSYRDEYDFATQIYIDPSALTNGSGTIGSPLNYFPSTMEDNTAYLIKAGTTINPFPNQTKTVNETYIGRYGSGANPILIGVGVMFQINEGSEGFCLNGLTIKGQRASEKLSPILNLPAESYTVDRLSPIEFTYCNIQGIAHPQYGYPYNLIKSDVDIMYHCELSYSNDDLWFTGSLVNALIHTNYFHHANQSNGTGDGVQVEFTLQNTKYINNIIDRRGTVAKYCLIVNQKGGPNYNNDVLYNTMYGSDPGNGGAVMQWVGGPGSKLSKNIFVANQNWLFNTWTTHAVLPDDDGIRDNVYINVNESNPTGGNFELDMTFHRDFGTMSEYIIWQQQYPDEFYGSDIDPNNFWNQ